MVFPVVWRRVYLPTRQRAEQLKKIILTTGGYQSRVVRLIRSIRVDNIGPANLGAHFVPQSLVTEIAQCCTGLRRLDAPMSDLRPAVLHLSYLAKIQSLSLLDIPHTSNDSTLRITTALASLASLKYLTVGAKLDLDVRIAPRPTFSLQELCWATKPSSHCLDWVLQNSGESLTSLSFTRCPKSPILGDLLHRYGRGLLALRLYVSGVIPGTDMVSLRLSERCPSLVELLIDHAPLRSFLASLPRSLEHFAFMPNETMEYWETQEMDSFIRDRTSLRILSVTGHHAASVIQLEVVEQQLQGEIVEEADPFFPPIAGCMTDAQKRDVFRRWALICNSHKVRLHVVGDDWPWVRMVSSVLNGLDGRLADLLYEQGDSKEADYCSSVVPNDRFR